MKRVGSIALGDVPDPPDVPGDVQESNGDVVYSQGLERWRFAETGELRYFIRYEDERENTAFTYEAPRRRR